MADLGNLAVNVIDAGSALMELCPCGRDWH